MRCAARKLILAAMAGVLMAPASAAGADGHSLTVSATVLSKNNCRFSTAASTLALAIDPASSSPVSASSTLSVRCTGSAAFTTWSLSGNSGLHGASPAARRLRHGTNPAELLAYSLSFPASGAVARNVWQSVTLTAAVQPADFQNASVGLYSDQVTLSLLP